MSKYGMVMDLDRCIGCNACVIACKVEHNTAAGINFTKILEQETGTYPDAGRHFLPVMCNHCDDAPCIDVCPTRATYAREKDGIVLVDWDKCIGCGACVLACPYDFWNPQRHGEIAHVRWDAFLRPVTVEAFHHKRRLFGLQEGIVHARCLCHIAGYTHMHTARDVTAGTRTPPQHLCTNGNTFEISLPT